MEKKVGSVDLEELKKAREALNNELGIENDPNMYNNYNPNRETEEQDAVSSENLDSDFSNANNNESLQDNDVQSEDSTLSNSEDSVTIDGEDSFINIPVEDTQEQNSNDSQIDYSRLKNEQPEEQDFDVYDKFSDFEVEETATAADNSQASDNEESSEISKEDESLIDLAATDFLDSFDTILDKEEISETTEETTATEELETENVDDVISENDSDILETQDSLADLTEKAETEQENTNLENTYKSEDIKSDSTGDTSDFGELDIIDDYRKLESLSELLKEKKSQIAVLEKEDEKQEAGEIKKRNFKPIVPFNFVDIIATDEFKNSDKLSYILGKDENNDVIYANIRDCFNTAIFGINADEVYNQMNSMILSLMLKNSENEINFVICDSKIDSMFDVYNKSSYMYYNRIAKTNREILDLVIDLSKELDSRYEKLVDVGVKSIESYNILAKERMFDNMPYIVLLFNHYTKASQLLDAAKINSCIYNLLKFGRIAGIYVIIGAEKEIVSTEVNYNLPTRIAFKLGSDYSSISAVGQSGAELIDNDNEFLYLTVYDEVPKHMKSANISSDEIEIIIDNLEN